MIRSYKYEGPGTEMFPWTTIECFIYDIGFFICSFVNTYNPNVVIIFCQLFNGVVILLNFDLGLRISCGGTVFTLDESLSKYTVFIIMNS